MSSKPKNLDEMDNVSDEGSQVSDVSTENSDHQTNSEISCSSSENEDESSTDNALQFRLAELEAFFGLLYLSGVSKSNHEDTRSLFATDGTGRDIFRATMSKNRFLFLSATLRFDDASIRDERNETGPLAGI
ncbi:hypothetical protein PR048_003963 [Dryococelus australis]|uniref:PiggyBac transposable element-derived protein domain-containing protein n=1 Tax=Dryococelus australis TaxID=614101 RepID=A0ABQ9I451_9NEOP|nr:hypothetical protein PR048_003963 [Dryococelus australis]